jgi:hypothetical protein
MTWFTPGYFFAFPHPKCKIYLQQLVAKAKHIDQKFLHGFLAVEQRHSRRRAVSASIF